MYYQKYNLIVFVYDFPKDAIFWAIICCCWLIKFIKTVSWFQFSSRSAARFFLSNSSFYLKKSIVCKFDLCESFCFGAFSWSNCLHCNFSSEMCINSFNKTSNPVGLSPLSLFFNEIYDAIAHTSISYMKFVKWVESACFILLSLTMSLTVWFKHKHTFFKDFTYQQHIT